MRGIRIVLTIVIAVLLVSVLLPAQAQGKGPEAVGLRPDAPDYAKHGPFWVGARELTFQDGQDKVGMIVWYPALNPKNDKEAIDYTVSMGLGTPEKLLMLAGHALRDAASDTSKAPYPLILFSPGLAVWDSGNSYVLEHLASYGFVVISWNPRGESMDEFWKGAAYRLGDPKLVIARAEELTAVAAELAGMIDTEHIATTGHSSGGFAALAGGGAQMNFGWCAAHQAEVAKNPLSNCGQFVPHQDEIAAMLGLTSTPKAMWPTMSDPRVKAVVSMAGDGDIWGANYEGISQLKVPTMVMGGSGDTVNVPQLTSYPIYEHLGSEIKSRVIFANGDHEIFLSPCEAQSWLAEVGYSYCSDTVWDMDRVHDLIDHFVTAFMLDVLKGDKDAHKALLPDAVKFPGVEYTTTMK